MAASNAMIATTIISSISVNPCALARIVVSRIPALTLGKQDAGHGPHAHPPQETACRAAREHRRKKRSPSCEGLPCNRQTGIGLRDLAGRGVDVTGGRSLARRLRHEVRTRGAALARARHEVRHGL